MKIRLFNLDDDFDVIKTWISDERTHMLWCANRIQFPMTKSAFKEFLEIIASQSGDVPHVATEDDGNQVGFYTYSVNENTKEGMCNAVLK